MPNQVQNMRLFEHRNGPNGGGLTPASDRSALVSTVLIVRCRACDFAMRSLGERTCSFR